MTQGRPQLSKQESIDALRAQIQPEHYVASLEKMKATYLERAAELLGNRDLNAASGAIDERDVDMVNVQLDEALADLSWRIATIDERIADFKETKENVTRPFDRQEPEEPKEAELGEESGEDVQAGDEAAREAVAVAEEALAAPGGAPPEDDEDLGEPSPLVEADPNEEA